MMKFYNGHKLRAAKTHRCFICNTDIFLNELYIRCSGKYDGEFFDQCFHKSCKELLDKFIYDSNDCEYDPV